MRTVPTVATFFVLATTFGWSRVDGFVTPSSGAHTRLARKQQCLRTTTTLFEAPNNFADVAETIADAAAALRGKTIVVKYGGVRGT